MPTESATPVPSPLLSDCANSDALVWLRSPG